MHFAPCFPTVINSVFNQYNTLWSNSNAFSLLICKIYMKREIADTVIEEVDMSPTYLKFMKYSCYYIIHLGCFICIYMLFYMIFGTNLLT